MKAFHHAVNFTALLLLLAGTCAGDDDVVKLESELKTVKAQLGPVGLSERESALSDTDEYKFGARADWQNTDRIMSMVVNENGSITLRFTDNVPYFNSKVNFYSGVQDADKRLALAGKVLSLTKRRLLLVGAGGDAGNLNPFSLALTRSAAAVNHIPIAEAIKHNKKLGGQPAKDIPVLVAELMRLETLIAALGEAGPKLDAYRAAAEDSAKLIRSGDIPKAIEAVRAAGTALGDVLSQSDRVTLGLSARESDLTYAANLLEQLDLGAAMIDPDALDLFQFMEKHARLKSQSDLLSKGKLPEMFNASAVHQQWLDAFNRKLAELKPIAEAAAKVQGDLKSAFNDVEQLGEVQADSPQEKALRERIELALLLKPDPPTADLVRRTMDVLRKQLDAALKAGRIKAWTARANTGLIDAESKFRRMSVELRADREAAAAGLRKKAAELLKELAALRPESPLTADPKDAADIDVLNARITADIMQGQALMQFLTLLETIPKHEKAIRPDATIAQLTEASMALADVDKRLVATRGPFEDVAKEIRDKVLILSKRASYQEADVLRRSTLAMVEQKLAEGDIDRARKAFAALADSVGRVRQAAAVAEETPPANLTDGIDGLGQRINDAVQTLRRENNWFEPWAGAGLVADEPRIRWLLIQRLISQDKLDEAEQAMNDLEKQSTMKSALNDSWRTRFQEDRALILIRRAELALQDDNRDEAKSFYAQAKGLSEGASASIAAQALQLMRAQALSSPPTSLGLAIAGSLAGGLALAGATIIGLRLRRRRRLARLTSRLRHAQGLARQGRNTEAAREAHRIMLDAAKLRNSPDAAPIADIARHIAETSVNTVPLPQSSDGTDDDAGIRHLIANPRPSLVEVKRAASWLAVTTKSADASLRADAIRWLSTAALDRAGGPDRLECLELVSEAAAAAPEGELSACAAGLALRAGRHADAERLCRRGVALNPSIPVQNQLLILLGQALIQLDRSVEAVKLLQAAIKKRPEPSLRKWLGIATGFAVKTGRTKDPRKASMATTQMLSDPLAMKHAATDEPALEETAA